MCTATVASILAEAAPGLQLDEHFEHDDGEWCSAMLAKLGLEGIVPSARARPTALAARPDWLR